MIKKAGTKNPVFLLDEVDKMSVDFRGDPASALMEVLDPEQNNTFLDHYIDTEYDLSQVMFIVTANVIESIPRPLIDRMEIIRIPGYTEEEKLQIALRHLIPKQIKENALSEKYIVFTKGAIKKIISLYTRESGVRNLEREIASVCRKVARKVAEGKEKPSKITSQNVETYLGPPKVFRDQLLKKDRIGVTTGVAWTASGGEILFVEATKMTGNRSLTLTGLQPPVRLGKIPHRWLGRDGKALCRRQQAVERLRLYVHAFAVGLAFEGYDEWHDVNAQFGCLLGREPHVRSAIGYNLHGIL